MPMSIGEPTPEIDPLLKIKRSDTAENLRQKADTLRQYHGELELFEQYNTTADRLDETGFHTFGEWEKSVLAGVGLTVQQAVEMLADKNDPIMDFDS